jgi:cyclic pyranopterin phosphate synthase
MSDEGLVQIGQLGGAKTTSSPFGRLSAYALRIGLLEQCQLRCSYCLPGEGRPYTERSAWLTAQEHARLAPLFSRRGIEKVRFTGGEPLLREDVVDIVAAWRAALPRADLALTTNGARLAERINSLIDGGLNRLNVHVDSLRADRYQTMMGKGDPAPVLEAAAHAATRMRQVKLNVVAQRGLNDDELASFLDWSVDSRVEVRFIELMDTGSAPDHVKRTFMSGDDVLAHIAGQRPFDELEKRHPSDPASLFRVRDTGVTFGVIASDTRPFCERCDRMRLTADGRLRGCLYAPDGVSLRDPLREGEADDKLLSIIDAGLDDKRSWHPDYAVARPGFSMADVGG